MATAENLDAFDALRHLVHNIKATGKRLNLGLAMEHAERVLAAGPELSRLQAGGQGAEPIYQYRKADGTWIDQDKHSYDYNVQDGAINVRILYAHPPAAPESNRYELTYDEIMGNTVWHGPGPGDLDIPGTVRKCINAYHAKRTAAPALVPLSTGKRHYMITNYFSEDWAVMKAADLLDDYTTEFCRINGLTVGGDGGEKP